MHLRALLSPLLLITSALATTPPPPPEAARDYNIKSHVSFPDSAAAPQKLVNGVPTRMHVHIHNDEEGPVVVEFISASLVDPATQKVVKNFTAAKVAQTLEGEQSLEHPYGIVTDLKEQDGELVVGVVMTVGDGEEVITIQAYNGTVTVVEEEMGVFDPQMLFLYLLLATIFTGVTYLVYTTWFASVTPRRRRKEAPKKEEKKEGEGAAQASGYEEEWIPEHHLKGTKKGGNKRGRKAAE